MITTLININGDLNIYKILNRLFNYFGNINIIPKLSIEVKILESSVGFIIGNILNLI